MEPQKITVETKIKAPIQKVWDYWTKPEHIKNWCFASDDWHCPSAENDLKVGGKFTSRMEAKDGSFGFDFGGTYDIVEHHHQIGYAMNDERRVDILFKDQDGEVEVIETFDAETQNPIEMQKGGWQAILNNFKKLVENS